MSDLASLGLFLFKVIAVIKLDVSVHFSIGSGSPRVVVSRENALSVPPEETLSNIHVFDVLTLMGGLIQDEGGVSGEYYFIACETISAAAVLNFGVLIVLAVWQRPSSAVLVVTPCILVIPFYPSLFQT